MLFYWISQWRSWEWCYGIAEVCLGLLIIIFTFYTHTLVSNGVTSGRDWGGGRGGKESGSQAGPEFFGHISTICESDLIWKNIYYWDNLMTGPNQALV